MASPPNCQTVLFFLFHSKRSLPDAALHSYQAAPGTLPPDAALPRPIFASTYHSEFRTLFCRSPKLPTPALLFVKLLRIFGSLSNQNSPPPNLTQLLSCAGRFTSSTSLCSNLLQITSGAIFSAGPSFPLPTFLFVKLRRISGFLSNQDYPPALHSCQMYRVLSLLKTRIPFLETISIVQPAGTFQLKKV